MSEQILIRRATPDDAASINSIWQVIAAEKIYSAIDKPFTIEEERAYIQSLSEREGVFLAEIDGSVIGFQSLDLWARSIHSMDHVGQLGTFALSAWRKHGVGNALAQHTLAFAKAHGYEKLVIFVRASNTSAQKFYAGLGFIECGRFARQVKIDGKFDDEILMELFL
ncbi:MAG: GNAT family N-acetyltransferase [Chloroflexi bacterium]|nr:GNAT family N-acetyltransferase [Chloroflexota bacterium]